MTFDFLVNKKHVLGLTVEIEQNMSEEEKQTYLDSFPLLPFSLVVDEGLIPTIN